MHMGITNLGHRIGQARKSASKADLGHQSQHLSALSQGGYSLSVLTFAAVYAKGYPVAFEARADDRESRALTSITR